MLGAIVYVFYVLCEIQMGEPAHLFSFLSLLRTLESGPTTVENGLYLQLAARRHWGAAAGA